jgi:predicted nucleic acid-binding Zn ribbon protein
MSGKKKKTDSIESLGSVIDKIMQSGLRQQDAPLLQVWELWEKAVGEIIAENARPAAFKGNILLVHVNSSPWLHQLSFLKKDILARINRELGQQLVDEIKFKIGPL